MQRFCIRGKLNESTKYLCCENDEKHGMEIKCINQSKKPTNHDVDFSPTSSLLLHFFVEDNWRFVERG